MKVWETSYNEIRLEIRDPRKGEYDDTDTVLSWSPKRYAHTLRLKQEAIDKARRMWVDYVFFIDADNILLHSDVLNVLIRRNKTVVGPMLETGVAFSNYWSAQVKNPYFRLFLSIGKCYKNVLRIWKLATMNAVMIITKFASTETFQFTRWVFVYS